MTEKQANELKGQTLNEYIIKEKFIEKWNGELPKVMSDDNMIDISNMMKSNES